MRWDQREAGQRELRSEVLVHPLPGALTSATDLRVGKKPGFERTEENACEGEDEIGRRRMHRRALTPLQPRTGGAALGGRGSA